VHTPTLALAGSRRAALVALNFLSPLACVAALALALTASVGRAEEDTKDYVPNEKWAYKTVDGKPLELHAFLPSGYKPTDRRPVIVFFFGGGWNGGSPSQFYPHCAYFASRGMVALSADYRVKNRNATTPRECVIDGKAALRWLRQHAAERGIDPQRIAAGGGSAGGHVAAAIATVRGFDEPGADLRLDSRPNALVLFNPVFDNSPEGWGHDRVKDYWREISPLHNLDAQTPPTAVFSGSLDKLIPAATVRRFGELMKAAGRRCDVHIYEGQNHGFFNYRVPEYYWKTVETADRFLAALGFLTGQPTQQPKPAK